MHPTLSKKDTRRPIFYTLRLLVATCSCCTTTNCETVTPPEELVRLESYYCWVRMTDNGLTIIAHIVGEALLFYTPLSSRGDHVDLSIAPTER